MSPAETASCLVPVSPALDLGLVPVSSSLTDLLVIACTFLGPSRKRGPPKGYIDAIEARLHQTEALIGVMLAYNDDRVKSIFEDLSQVGFTSSNSLLCLSCPHPVGRP